VNLVGSVTYSIRGDAMTAMVVLVSIGGGIQEHAGSIKGLSLSPKVSESIPLQNPTTNMSTRTERFQRKPREKQDTKDEAVADPEEVLRFSPEEEAVSSLLCHGSPPANAASHSWSNPTPKKPKRISYSRTPLSKMPLRRTSRRCRHVRTISTSRSLCCRVTSRRAI
jgi:hypothetical protein